MVQGRRPRIFGLFAVAAVDAGALFAYETGWRSDAAPERGAVRVNTILAALAEGAARRLAAALDEQWRLHQSVAAALQPWGPERDGAAAQVNTPVNQTAGGPSFGWSIAAVAMPR